MDKLHNGIDEYLSGNLPKAITLLKEYINENGYDKGSAYYHLGLCFSDLNQLTPACENFAKACEISPEKSMYHYKLGLIYFRLMALDKAEDSLSKTISLNPEHQRSRFLLGRIYFQKGLMVESEKKLTEVLEKSPDFADAYYHRAMALYQLGKNQEALKDLHIAIEINPDYTDALLEASKINFEHSNFIQSAEECRAIYNKGNRSFSFIKYYLNVLSKAGIFDEFETIKSEALILFPNNQEILSLIRWVLFIVCRRKLNEV